MKKDKLNAMTVTQFRALRPMRVSWEDVVRCSSVVILPTGERHGSGYGIMEFVPIRDGKILGRLGGCTDDVEVGRRIDLASDFRIDCLLRSRLLNIWRSGFDVLIQHRLSSTEIRFERAA